MDVINIISILTNIRGAVIIEMETRNCVENKERKSTERERSFPLT